MKLKLKKLITLIGLGTISVVTPIVSNFISSNVTTNVVNKASNVSNTNDLNATTQTIPLNALFEGISSANNIQIISEEGTSNWQINPSQEFTPVELANGTKITIKKEVVINNGVDTQVYSMNPTISQSLFNNRMFHGKNIELSYEQGYTTVGTGAIDTSSWKDELQLTSVVLPNTVTSIEANGFANNKYLTKVNLKGVNTITKGAFNNCINLTKDSFINLNRSWKWVQISENTNDVALVSSDVTSWTNNTQIIGTIAFGTLDFNYINKANANPATQISENQFKGVSGLNKVILDKNITVINNNAFKNASSITIFDFKDSNLKTIG
ncbi:MAG: leucine-rich repeat domain-containing protein [Mycoplasma sp.]